MIFGPKWILRRPEAASSVFCETEGEIIGQWLWSRGLEDTRQRKSKLEGSFSDIRSPFNFLNMRASAERLADALENPEEKIAIYSDYDMDGMSGLAILKTFLESLSPNPIRGYYPNRLEEGYGVHPSALEELGKEGIRVVVTVDTGITALAAAEKARELGIVLIITDHHKQVSDKLPDTPFIVNPNQKMDTSGMPYISGAGMAFFVCMALRTVLRERRFFENKKLTEPRLVDWLDLFVLGTIADVVDLVGENRILVKAGLETLARTQRPGLRALLNRCLRDPHTTEISARDVAFSVTPKLNAASRMGHAHLSASLLVENSVPESEVLADQIMALNAERSRVQEEVLQLALSDARRQIAEFDPPVLVTFGPWHEGILGVVAARLVEEFNRAAIVLNQKANEETLRGSMRGKLPLSCVRLLDQVSDILLSYGGHTQAAGLKLHKNHLGDFCRRIWQNSKEFFLKNPQNDEVLFDGFLDLNKNLKIEEIEQLHQIGSPWGQGNPDALFLLKDIPLSSVQRLKENHVRCQLSDTLGIIGFSKFKEIEALQNSASKNPNFDALLTLEINRFRNKKSVQLNLRHVRPSENFNSGS